MPEDPDGGAFVFVNTESLADSRVRQLSAAQQALLYALAMQAADEGRAGWVPIQDGEIAAGRWYVSIPRAEANG